MQSTSVVGLALLSTAALGAQSPPQAEMPWKQFRAPDSTFAIMYHSFMPPERSARDTGYVSEDIYTSEMGTTTVSVRRLSHRAGASIRHMPSVDGFCATCLGRVLSDTTIRDVRHAWRWVLVERDSPDSGSKVTAVYRLVEVAGHVYIVSAASAPGKPLSPGSGWFLESFRLCVVGDLCPVVADGQPPWTISRFQYLAPSGGGSTEMLSGTPDFGQAFLDYQVDEPARKLPDSPAPIYPAALKVRGVEGDVVVTFVVDASGAVEVPTFTVVRSTDSLFVSAVRAALPAMKFLPATINNKKVRQLVQQSFPFKLPH
jgi:TonB family protein